jgi:Ser/Thr protein kinase RdoA (MazF antagonist)
MLTAFIESGAYPHEPDLQTELFVHTGQAIARLHRALASYPEAELRNQTWREDFAARVAGWIAALSTGLSARDGAIVTRVGRTHGEALATALRELPEQFIISSRSGWKCRRSTGLIVTLTRLWPHLL